MQVTDEMVRAGALACRKRQFDRTGAGRAFDATCPPTDNELDNARATITAALAAMWRPSGDEPKDRSFLLAIDDDGVEYHVAKFIGADKKTLIVGGAFGFDRKGKRLGWHDIAPITLPSPPKAEG